MASGILIGIDGGGTHSTAAAAWPDGRIAAAVSGGGLNFHNDGTDVVRGRLEDMVHRLENMTGAKAERICVGFSALDGPADEAVYSAFSKGALSREQLEFQSDAFVALMGLTQGRPGIIVICGTGSMLLLVDAQGNQIVSGGWGYLLNDAGSGYTLAREAVLAAIDGWDGIDKPVCWAQDVLNFFGVSSPRTLIDKVYAPDFGPDRMAGFARQLLTHAESGDEAAVDIVRRNMARLARLTASLSGKADGAGLVGLYGGIFQHSALARNLYSQALCSLLPDAQIVLPEYPPELGALIHLMKKHGLLTDAVLKNMKESYEEIRHEHA